MKQLYIIKFICLILFINSCSSDIPENKTEERVTIQASAINHKIVQSKLNNPALMNGSSFANYFQALYKLGSYEDMLLFTSQDLIAEYGKERILKSYRKMDFAYEIKLKSIKTNKDSSYTLNYLSVQFATNKMIRVNVVIENDTVKLLDSDFLKLK